MSSPTEEIASLPIPFGQYNVSVTTVQSLVLPTTQKVKFEGELQVTISFESQNCRFTIDGSTPSATNGVLVTAPAILTFRGEQLIKAIKIISVAVGGVINYIYTAGAKV